MTDQEMKKKFMTDLVSKYGYPKESVKSDVWIGSNVFDVAIPKGTSSIHKNNKSTNLWIIMNK